jgi:hypothetical protein
MGICIKIIHVQSKYEYLYENHLVLSSIAPSTGPEFGGVSVTIYDLQKYANMQIWIVDRFCDMA